MKTICTTIIWILLLSYNSAAADGIGCPKGTEPKGEQAPEVSEAWCEKSVNGKVVMHGPYRSWWPNGKLGTEGQYENGTQVGLWRGWYESGELHVEELFENGRKVKGRYYDKQGKAKSKP